MKIKHEGLHADRLKQGNPREVAFAEQWKEENQNHINALLLRNLLIKSSGHPFMPFSGTVKELAPYDQQSASVAATVIQWLGSNVGIDFLRMALKRCGLKIVQIDNGRDY